MIKKRHFVQACAGMCKQFVQGKTACLLACAGCASIMRAHAREKIFINNLYINILARVYTPLHTLHTLHTRVYTRLSGMCYACTCLHMPAHAYTYIIFI
jgi:hypothetical protein